MKASRFNTRGIARILAFLFAFYISLSLLIIVFPGISFGKRATQIYKRYISPGPFFTASRITDTKLLYLSWKTDGDWNEPINPPLIHYSNFFKSWNPTLMYKCRMETSIYEKIIIENKMKSDSLARKPFEWTSTYFQKHYVPPDADSTKIILINSSTKEFKTKVDTLQIILF